MSSEPIMPFDKLYDKYCSILYGIALEISSSQKEAEQILASTFKIAHARKLIEKNKHSLCAELIKITIQSAYEHLKPKNNFRLKQFENTPILQKLLCDKKFLDVLCKDNSENPSQKAKQIRLEFNTLRNIKEINYQGASISL